jgi:hypothetical protein
LSQTALDDDPPLVLDATCSDKKIWPRFASIRMDIRRDVNPDIVASACYLPFRTGVFQAIYCDPPHIIDSRGWRPERIERLKKIQKERHNNFIDFVRFGIWRSKSEWFKFLSMTDKEFCRCLKASGQTIFKITNGRYNGMTKVSHFSIIQHFEIIDKKFGKPRSFGDDPPCYLTMKPIPPKAPLTTVESSIHS